MKQYNTSKIIVKITLRHRQWITVIAGMVLFVFQGLVMAGQSQYEFAAESMMRRAESGNILQDSTMQLYTSLLEYATQHQLKSFQAEAHYALGKHHLLRTRHTEARTHLSEATRLFAILEDYDNEGFALERLGVAYQHMEYLDSALICFEQALSHYRKHKRPHRKWNPYLGLSSVYQKLGKVDESLEYGRLAWTSVENTSDRTTKIIVLMHLMRLTSAIDSMALYTGFADQMLRLYTPLEIDNRRVHHVQHFLAVADPAQRIVAIKEFLGHIGSLDPTLEHVFSYYSLGEAYSQTGDWRSALEAWHEGYVIEYEQLGMLHYRLILLRALSTGYENAGEPVKALDYFRRYSTLKDSLTQLHNQEKIEELRVRYETESKDTEIALQRAELRRKTIERNITWVSAGILLLAIGMVVYSMRRRLRDQKTIARQREKIHEQEMDQLRQEHALATLQTLISSQENERVRIASDLHDGLGSLLGTIKTRFSALEHNTQSAEEDARYRMVDNLINTASAEVRRISHNMAPRALSLHGLRDAVADLASQLKTPDLDVEFQWHGPAEKMDEKLEIMLYRIIQELSTNCIKYAHAKSLWIQINRHEDIMNLIVEDDGVGFDIDTAGEPGSLGLHSIRSRVSLLNGQMHLDTRPGEGTAITIQIPLQAQMVLQD